MPLKEYFLNNFVMLFELIGLLIILFISAHVSKRIKSYTRAAVILLFVSMLVTAFETWTQTFETLSLWRPILTALKYTIYPLILLDIIFLVSQNIKPISNKWRLIVSIPALVCIPIYFTSQWTHIVFYFLQDNHYNGGPLSNLPYIIFTLYLVLFVALNIIYLRNYSTRNRFIALYICLASALCVVIYIIVDKTDDYNPIFTASLVFYFLFMYIHLASIDPLTGLRNRQSYYQDISETGNRVTCVMSVDMNNLKELNDTEGHAAGDNALIEVAKSLMKSSGKRIRCYRIGGDEFMILLTLESQEEIDKQIERIKESLNNCPYPCAFGYAKITNDKTIDDAIKESDKQMYLNKAEMKANKSS